MAFAVVLGVLVAAAGVFVTLFLLERSAAAEIGGEVTVTERELTDARERLANEKSTVDELADEEQDLVDAKEELAACADPTRKALQAAGSGTDQELSDALEQMLLHCGR